MLSVAVQPCHATPALVNHPKCARLTRQMDETSFRWADMPLSWTYCELRSECCVQIRASAAAVIQMLLEGPPQRAFLAIAEVQAQARHVVRYVRF